jgi:hypothetical protein
MDYKLIFAKNQEYWNLAVCTRNCDDLQVADVISCQLV